jgi:hypothetical protein
MSYRKGELTGRAVDRDYPHQVELPADLTTGRNNNVAQEFCRDLSLAPRGAFTGAHTEAPRNPSFLICGGRKPGVNPTPQLGDVGQTP